METASAKPIKARSDQSMATTEEIVKPKQVDVSIIIVAYNGRELMEKCLTCIRKSRDTLDKEIIFVDNGSTDRSAERIKELFPEIKLVETPVNLGFAKANNLGYAYASGKYILMLNSDAFVGEDTLQNMADFLENTPDCGIAGCLAVNGKGILQPSVRYFPTPWRLFLAKTGLAEVLPMMKDNNNGHLILDEVTECDWVTGCCLMVRKEIVDTFEFFLRPQYHMYNDDNDLCFRVKEEGWKVYCLPDKITHLVGATNDKISVDENDQKRFQRLILESQYIYFRHNYGIFSAFSHLFFTALIGLLKLAKNIALFKGTAKIKDNVDNLRMAFREFYNTKGGKHTSIK